LKTRTEEDRVDFGIGYEFFGFDQMKKHTVKTKTKTKTNKTDNAVSVNNKTGVEPLQRIQ